MYQVIFPLHNDDQYFGWKRPQTSGNTVTDLLSISKNIFMPSTGKNTFEKQPPGLHTSFWHKKNDP